MGQEACGAAGVGIDVAIAADIVAFLSALKHTVVTALEAGAVVEAEAIAGAIGDALVAGYLSALIKLRRPDLKQAAAVATAWAMCKLQCGDLTEQNMNGTQLHENLSNVTMEINH